MGMPGGFELFAIVAVIVLLFGGKKIPELAKGLGQGIKNFKSAVKEDEAVETVTSTQKIDESNSVKTTSEVKNAAIGLFEAANTWGIFSKDKTKTTKVTDLITAGKTSVLDLSVSYSALLSAKNAGVKVRDSNSSGKRFCVFSL